MSNMINTKHNVDKETKIAEREIDLKRPKVLRAKTIAELIKAIGEEMAFNDLMAQVEIKFRSKIRTLIGSKNDNGDWENSDEDVAASYDDTWVPEVRVRQTAEEKIAKLADGMTPDQLKAALAALQAKSK